MSWVSLGYRSARRAGAVLLVLLAATVLFRSAASAQGGEVRVAAAADMEPIFQVVGPYFERKTGLKLKVTFGSSAAVSQQLQNGLPADIFFSADYYFAEQLVASNLTETKEPTPYANGLLVLWTRKDSRFNPLHLEVLGRKDLQSVAIANPERAPYGRAAEDALKKLNYYANVQPHLKQAESVAQAAQFALTGNAELALMSETLAMSPKYKEAGTFVLFPLSQYPDIRQCAVILKAAKNADGAHQLLKFMLSDEVQNNLPKLGLQPAQ